MQCMLSLPYRNAVLDQTPRINPVRMRAWRLPMHHADKAPSAIYVFDSLLPDMSETAQVILRRRREWRA